MGTTRTAWHVLLLSLLAQRAPHRFEVRSEVPLSAEPLRVDYLLLRSVVESDEPGRTLRKLWTLLPKDTILEFKSIGRPYRSRNLDRLWAYLHLYYTNETERLERHADLCGVILVHARTPSLEVDAEALGLEWRDLGDGYWQLLGGKFALYVAEIGRVADAEDDDLLRLLGRDSARTAEGRRWLSEQLGAKETNMEMHELEGYDEVIQKILASLSPEQRLAGLAPEQRLAGLAPEQQLLALSDDMLRTLPDTYLATLPAATRAAIRVRIGR